MHITLLQKIFFEQSYRFRPLWLRSSVVSVLQSLTTLTPGTSRAKLSTLFLELESLKGSACRPLSRVGLLLQYRQESALLPREKISFLQKFNLFRNQTQSLRNFISFLINLRRSPINPKQLNTPQNPMQTGKQTLPITPSRFPS